nr:hypothetical protein [uncultured Dyadobacter sp.]
MKNLQLITLILAFLFSLIFSHGIAQQHDLAMAGPNRVNEELVPAADPAGDRLVANPLTSHFGVMPKITVNDNGNVFVYIFNPRHTDLNVRFSDEGGNALHQDKTTTLYYGKLLNVSELQAGDYELTLQSDAVSARYVVKIGWEARKVKVNQVAAY